MDTARKPRTPDTVTITRAANKGFIVRHSYDNSGSGESYQPSQEHVFGDHASLMTHVHGVMAASPDAQVAGVKDAPKPSDAPTTKTYGAGVD